ncbi:hypothetical protein AF306_15165 [Listeria monocytogenes]|nr:hypothetical protein [Listeria monocytogenes]EAD8590382.1 hypothetical protein [Listeria monocytogenes]EAD8593709.1 hypothetical protein [Listeria monocytogenes]EAD8602544.1 hypothetical protein [Listeria monocytogenes]
MCKLGVNDSKFIQKFRRYNSCNRKRMTV